MPLCSTASGCGMPLLANWASKRYMEEWSNWSGSLRFVPGSYEQPSSEEELAALVHKAADKQQTVRVVGAGHSSSPLVKTGQVLVSLEELKEVKVHDLAKSQAWVGGGVLVHEAGEQLHQLGMATHNTGDVDVQTIAGAIGTGTHGSGITLPNLSTMLIGGRLVTSEGELIELSAEQDPKLFQALRVSLGTLGIFSSLKLQLVPKFQLDRKEWCTHTDHCMEHLDELIEQNRNFDFYWYPRNDMVKLRTLNPPNKGIKELPYASLVKEEKDWSAFVLPKKRVLKFDEMEYAMPLEAGPACFQEIRRRVKQVHRKTVAWRILYRTVKGDDAYLSPAHGRDTVTISLHHNAGMPFDDYFNDIEPIFLAHGGRPHWGKKHNLTAKHLSQLYPKWNDFLAIRERMDPKGVFLSPDLRKLLLHNFL